MKKVIVEICIGTNCYVMGGVDLLQLEDCLPPEMVAQVEIKGTPCIDTCFKQQKQKPPFVVINGQVMEQATISKIKEELTSILNH